MSVTSTLNQSISVKNPGARDRHGSEALGTAVTYRARFQKTTKVILTAQKEKEPIDGIVFVDANAAISRGAQLTYGSVTYRVMRIDDIIGLNGATDHFELMVQEWFHD